MSKLVSPESTYTYQVLPIHSQKQLHPLLQLFQIIPRKIPSCQLLHHFFPYYEGKHLGRKDPVWRWEVSLRCKGFQKFQLIYSLCCLKKIKKSPDMRGMFPWHADITSLTGKERILGGKIENIYSVPPFPWTWSSSIIGITSTRRWIKPLHH